MQHAPSSDDAGSRAFWRLPLAATPSICEWQGDYVVYNPLSGDTHLLDVVAGEVLKLVVSRPAAAVDIVGSIASFLEVPNDAPLAKHVGQILARLDDLGLIEPAS